MTPLRNRIETLDWATIEDSLHLRGSAALPALLTAEECAALVSLYGDAGRFRKRVVMEKHGFGQGEYQYFHYPLPETVDTLWRGLYPHLARVANHWQEALKRDDRFPAAHADYLARCHGAGQARPTPLLLRYVAGDYNCLHKDLYGDEVFPLQVTFLLSRPGRDFSGGEFVLTEQRPRMQSRPEVVHLSQGDAVVFAVAQRPVRGTRGFYRVNMRHGVSRLLGGERYTLGVIFHDAK